MAKRTLKINIKLPTGVSPTYSLINEATEAAKKVVDSAASDIIDAQKIVKDMSKRGIQMTVDEVLERKSGSKRGRTAPKKQGKGSRKRVVLTDEQRQALAEDLRNGMKIKDAQDKYGVSQATVTNIKSAEGLTKKRS
ncbi:MAG: hypothetical protein ACLFS1_00430 [Opitutales bacterium]